MSVTRTVSGIYKIFRQLVQGTYLRDYLERQIDKEFKNSLHTV